MISKAKDNIATIVVFCTLIGLAFSAFVYFAPVARVQAVEQEVKSVKLSIRFEKVQERIWLLEGRYLNPDSPRTMPQSVKEELRELKAELELLKAKLKVD